MADNKMTRAQALAIAIEVVADEEAREVLSKMKESIKKKNSSSKPKKVTEAQTFLRNDILRVLGESDKPLTVGEILERLDVDLAPEGTKFSTSSVTANIGTMLVNGKTENPDGLIVRSVEGKSAKFALAEGADEGEEE